jgi:hypothetical protein
MQDGTGSVALVEKFEKYEAYVLAAPFAGDPSPRRRARDVVRAQVRDVRRQSFAYTRREQIGRRVRPRSPTTCTWRSTSFPTRSVGASPAIAHHPGRPDLF